MKSRAPWCKSQKLRGKSQAGPETQEDAAARVGPRRKKVRPRMMQASVHEVSLKLKPDVQRPLSNKSPLIKDIVCTGQLDDDASVSSRTRGRLALGNTGSAGAVKTRTTKSKQRKQRTDKTTNKSTTKKCKCRLQDGGFVYSFYHS